VRTPPPLATLQSTAAERRPLLVSRRQALDAAEDDVARARGAWSPVLAFQTTYQKSGPDLTGSTGIFGDPGKQYFLTVQGTVSWNIFGGGETVEGVRRAGAQASRAVALLRSAEAQVSAEIATAREQVVTLAESVAVSQEALDAADKTLRFERELLDAGRATQLEVRDAALKLAQARLAAFGTLVDLAVADADLNRAVGGGP
jgi:outer membrane protein TolC